MLYQGGLSSYWHAKSYNLGGSSTTVAAMVSNLGQTLPGCCLMLDLLFYTKTSWQAQILCKLVTGFNCDEEV